MKKGKRSKEKKRERERQQNLGWDLHLGKGAVKKEKFLLTQEPLLSRESGEPCNLREEHSSTCSGGKMERIHHRDQCQPAIPSLKCLFPCLLWQAGSGC